MYKQTKQKFKKSIKRTGKKKDRTQDKLLHIFWSYFVGAENRYICIARRKICLYL